MCGIVGEVRGPRAAPRDTAKGSRALALLAPRGPDAQGEWNGPGVWLGHRRLAVLDLSPTGAQPMVSTDGRYVLCYNGEIYNHRALREDLLAAGVALRGHCDTEVLLALLARDGLDATLPRLNGMFAFALWDAAARVLHLARDRFGEKPLYYGVLEGTLRFASQPAALLALGEARPSLDRAALADYSVRGYVPDRRCIFEGVRKLAPGGCVSIAQDALPALPAPRSWWSVEQAAGAALAAPLAVDDREAVNLVEEALARAVACRLEADVPLGALLSGGIDSSLVVALMQRAAGRPVRTFSIGFDTADHDEAAHARAVAEHLGTVHTEQRVSAHEALAVIPRLPAIYDEPFADSSQVPSVLVAALARQHVTTALTGDGGDELFAGYLRYGPALGAWRRLRAWPAPLRAALVAGVEALPAARWNALGAALAPALPARLRYAAVGDKLHKLARLARAPDLATLHAATAALAGEARLVRDAVASPPAMLPRLVGLDAPGAMMLADARDYLPGDILAKVDRAAMTASLETRVPFLDAELFTLAWRLPARMKLRDGRTKWVLREVLARHVPPALTERAKAGFAVPLDAWLRGPLRAWADGLLDATRLSRTGLWETATIQRLWREHATGAANHHHALWAVLMFEAWREHWGYAA